MDNVDKCKGHCCVSYIKSRYLVIWSHFSVGQCIIKYMDISQLSHKEVGDLGERIAADYLRRNGFRIEGKNIAKKTGELDIVVRKRRVLHIIEVKSMMCNEFPVPHQEVNSFDPAENLHSSKIRKVVRTGQWYISERKWEGEWQVDGVLVWLRRRDGAARVRYLPQIV